MKRRDFILGTTASAGALLISNQQAAARRLLSFVPTAQAADSRIEILTAEPIGPRTPPYPTNHGQLDDEDEERRLDHRADD